MLTMYYYYYYECEQGRGSKLSKILPLVIYLFIYFNVHGKRVK